MKCKLQCLLAVGFMVASYYTMTVDRKIFKKFYNILDTKQKSVYKKIKMERLKIYIKASMCGLVISLLFKMMSKKENTSPAVSACMHSLLFSFTQYIVYNLHKKSDWMLNHLTEPKKIKLWLQKYKLMKGRWHMGLLVGVLGYGLMCYVVEENIIQFKNKAN